MAKTHSQPSCRGSTLGDTPTGAEIDDALSKEVSLDLEPEEEFLQSLSKKVESFETWRKRKERKKKKSRSPNLSILHDCVWKGCPEKADMSRRYSTEESARIATKISSSGNCTVVGNVSLPPNKIVAWNVKLLRSYCYGGNVWVGVAPSGVDQNNDNSIRNGWFFHCGDSTLDSGPPHNYARRKYALDRGVKTGDAVGVVMDTIKGELSFILNGVNYGVAYKRIPF